MGMVARYQSRISGPLLDRIDIHLDVPRVAYNDLLALQRGEPSAAVRARVEAARAVQQQRFAPHKRATLLVNADMGPGEVQEFCKLDPDGRNLMRAAMQQMNLTARGVHRTLKLARTIADLAGSEQDEPAAQAPDRAPCWGQMHGTSGPSTVGRYER